MKNVIQFFEYDKVSYDLFTPDQVSAIRRLHTITGGLYYNLGDKNFTFKEHVGVIQVNDLTIEILPKIDREDNKKGKWHDILLNMLKECRFMDADSSGYANLKLRSNSVLELYFEKYVTELEVLLRRGLIKRYRAAEGNQYSLKGRLLFSQHLNENLAHAERFYVQFDLYDGKHPLHQVLRQALEVVEHLMGYGQLSERVNHILAQWPEGKKLGINEGLFKRFPITRKTQAYQEALKIARMILLNYHPDLRGGRESVLALMFNMNDLWEEFIFRRLKGCERQLNWKVSDQRRFKYWSVGSQGKLLIPDILIECTDGKKIIIDTKWKRPFGNKPDDHDLRQLLAYKLYYQSGSAYLLYPCYEKESHLISGEYHDKPYKSNDEVFRDSFGLHGGLFFFNILQDDKLLNRSDFRTIIERLLCNFH
jgi:5-methylcytosine-specific restriction enzyme subunit McrC